MLARINRYLCIPWFLSIMLLTGGCGEADLPQTDSPPTSTVQAAASAAPEPTIPPVDAISGRVVAENDPVAGAIVRMQATERYAVSGEDGTFSLALNRGETGPFNLTGWAYGYYCSGPVQAVAGERNIEIELHAHGMEDHPDYAWLPSRLHPGQGEDQGCAQCHSGANTDLTFSLPVDEWMLDAHSMSAANPRFLSMYYGTDILGNQSPVTRRAYSRDYGSFPIGPDLSQPYFGPGYKLDFPATAGNCAACHLPAAAVNDPYGIDPNTVIGVEAEGLPCDFCHKVWDIQIDSSDNLPLPNMPGVLSMAFLRPAEGHQFFAGPFDDVAPGEDTYSAVQTQSVYCAACHFGVFWDTVIYNSYGEWLESPYSDPDTGRTCQDCHMPPTGATQFATSEAGGLTRDPETIFSHRMLGILDIEFLQNSLTVESDAYLTGGEVNVEVRILNDNTGHKIPTDSPLRNVILIVQATDAAGAALEQIAGPLVPEWGGQGEADQGYYAGLPGQGYALILEELWTRISPSGAYWNPTRVVSDTRLKPFVPEESRFVFDFAGIGSVNIHVRLIFRRAYRSLMDQKGWTDEDILLYERVFYLSE